ncbi:induced myeloid leukemia cell differentiation protein Mcl-1-like [Watersipora subatra]|uniref:induced myeloid leukemia cell differentiation protein Mcl-1-like n=1 Tax=Watersipora subatra TaxID=2589382 RepID=UPI00355AFA92
MDDRDAQSNNSANVSAGNSSTSPGAVDAGAGAEAATPPTSVCRLPDQQRPVSNISPLCRPASDEPNSSPNQTTSDNDSTLLGTRPKERHRHPSDNHPAVRAITIEGSRDNSPIRNISPFRSPNPSPRFTDNRSFILPTGPSPGSRVPSSVSDNSIYQPVTRPKSANASEPNNPAEPGRRYSMGPSPPSRLRLRPIRNRALDSECLPEDPQSREVVEQSEEVMQNYMFERYHRDRQAGLQNVPESPTLLENFTKRPQTKVSALGRRLATIGDEIDAKYQVEFQQMSRSLNITQGAFEEAYDAFKGVAMKLFDSGGLSMGRIVALLQFGYHLALDVLRLGVGDFMSNIVRWLVRFITVERITNVVTRTTQSIAEWIASQGGWQGAIEVFNRNILRDSLPAIAGYAAACVTLVAVVWWLRHP